MEVVRASRGSMDAYLLDASDAGTSVKSFRSSTLSSGSKLRERSFSNAQYNKVFGGSVISEDDVSKYASDLSYLSSIRNEGVTNLIKKGLNPSRVCLSPASGPESFLSLSMAESQNPYASGLTNSNANDSFVSKSFNEECNELREAHNAIACLEEQIWQLTCVSRNERAMLQEAQEQLLLLERERDHSLREHTSTSKEYLKNSKRLDSVRLELAHLRRTLHLISNRLLQEVSMKHRYREAVQQLTSSMESKISILTSEARDLVTILVAKWGCEELEQALKLKSLCESSLAKVAFKEIIKNGLFALKFASKIPPLDCSRKSSNEEYYPLQDTARDVCRHPSLRHTGSSNLYDATPRTVCDTSTFSTPRDSMDLFGASGNGVHQSSQQEEGRGGEGDSFYGSSSSSNLQVSAPVQSMNVAPRLSSFDSPSPSQVPGVCAWPSNGSPFNENMKTPRDLRGSYGVSSSPRMSSVGSVCGSPLSVKEQLDMDKYKKGYPYAIAEQDMKAFRGGDSVADYHNPRVAGMGRAHGAFMSSNHRSVASLALPPHPTFCLYPGCSASLSSGVENENSYSEETFSVGASLLHGDDGVLGKHTNGGSVSFPADGARNLLEKQNHGSLGGSVCTLKPSDHAADSRSANAIENMAAEAAFSSSPVYAADSPTSEALMKIPLAKQEAQALHTEACLVARSSPVHENSSSPVKTKSRLDASRKRVVSLQGRQEVSGLSRPHVGSRAGGDQIEEKGKTLSSHIQSKIRSCCAGISRTASLEEKRSSSLVANWASHTLQEYPLVADTRTSSDGVCVSRSIELTNSEENGSFSEERSPRVAASRKNSPSYIGGGALGGSCDASNTLRNPSLPPLLPVGRVNRSSSYHAKTQKSRVVAAEAASSIEYGASPSPHKRGMSTKREGNVGKDACYAFNEGFSVASKSSRRCVDEANTTTCTTTVVVRKSSRLPPCTIGEASSSSSNISSSLVSGKAVNVPSEDARSRLNKEASVASGQAARRVAKEGTRSSSTSDRKKPSQKAVDEALSVKAVSSAESSRCVRKVVSSTRKKISDETLGAGKLLEDGRHSRKSKNESVSLKTGKSSELPGLGPSGSPDQFESLSTVLVAHSTSYKERNQVNGKLASLSSVDESSRRTTIYPSTSSKKKTAVGSSSRCTQSRTTLQEECVVKSTRKASGLKSSKVHSKQEASIVEDVHTLPCLADDSDSELSFEGAVNDCGASMDSYLVKTSYM